MAQRLAAVGSTDAIADVLAESTPEEWQAGLFWYPTTHVDALASSVRYDLPLDVVVGVISALSPKLSWLRNVKAADRVISAYVNGEGRKSLTGTSVPCYRANVDKAWNILRSGSARDYFVYETGPKTFCFSDNILRPWASELVTVDRHAFRAWMADNNAGERLTARQYRLAAADFVTLASEYGVRPLQLQAIAWLTWKRLYADSPRDAAETVEQLQHILATADRESWTIK